MIKAKDAIHVARSMIGTPYSEMDCINLIKKVIRTAPGGVSAYTTAGTNTLWASYEAADKFRDLTWRQEGITGARAGMLAFVREGSDVSHVGLVTGEGTVIHSSKSRGGVVETALDGKNGWNLLAAHRHIDVYAKEGELVENYKAAVVLKDPTSKLNVRNAPDKGGDVIGRLGHGAEVTVLAESNGWAFVSYGDSGTGYVSAEYLEAAEEAEEEEAPQTVYTTLIGEDGQAVMLVGQWRVAED